MDNSPPAFPKASMYSYGNDGMSLRDWFAGQALGALILGRGPRTVDQEYLATITEISYTFADFMIEQRKKP